MGFEPIRCRFVGSVGLLATLLATTAAAQLTSSERRCIDQYNNKARLVAAAQGRAGRACVKDAGRGLEPAPEACLLADASGKVASAKATVSAAVQASCSDPQALPIVIAAATANAAHVQGPVRLVHDLFGADLDSAGIVAAPTDDGRCREHAVLRAAKLFDAQLKEFRKCKKGGMRSGTVSDEATLTAQCLSDATTGGIPDPKGRIAKKGAKLDADVAARCGALATPIATLFPGACAAAASASELSDCLERQTRCRVCETINTTDGTVRDCDLVDDGLDNDSCAASATAECGLGPGSEVQLHIVAIAVPLRFPISGQIDLHGDGPAMNGVGPARCDLVSVAPVNIPSIGFACLSPGGSCPDGRHDCDGGTPLGVDLHADADIGACTSNADCRSACTASCAGQGSVSTSAVGCTGFCSAGAEGACTTDLACALAGSGTCNGPEPVTVPNVCQCSCLDMGAGLPSPAGALQCQLPATLNIEVSPPCDGTDVIVPVGQTCVPLTTEATSALIDNPNLQSGLTVPLAGPLGLSGIARTCSDLDLGNFDGVVAGATDFFNTPLGDMVVGVVVNCGATPIPPTATATPSATATPTTTGSPTRTGTVTNTPTITLTPTETPTGTSAHLCVLEPSSRFSMYIAALPVPLQFALTGSYSPRVGQTAPDGTGLARCDDFSVAPLNIPCIGFVCLAPQAGCASGTRDCDGGTPLGVDVAADGNIGACTGNAQCQTSCDAHCAGMGKVSVPSGTGCTGFCSAGAMGACSSDAQCLPNDGACNGIDPIGTTGGICQCDCVDTGAGPPSGAGALQCQLGLDLTIETSTPCDGTDVLIDVGNSCLPLTTETATGIITDANFYAGNPGVIPNTFEPAVLAGSRTDCASVDSSVTDGLRTVGTAAFFGTALGDTLVTVELDCPGAVLPTVTVTRTRTPTPTGTVTATGTNTRTPTETRTPTNTRTATPFGTPPGTITPDLVPHTCNLDGTSSTIELHIFGLPVPLVFSLAGSIDVAGDSPSFGVGRATCEVQAIDPVTIPSIGVVCVSPGGSCATGTRDCDGSLPLGVDLFSDADIGTCTGNAGCQSACDTYCAGLGRVNTVSGTGCTGFCSAGSMAACTADAECAPANGACNGPDPVDTHAGICQCSCLDAAVSGTPAVGDLQCRLPLGLNVESALPCGDGDVIVAIGDACVPLTTQTATALITDANFQPGSTVPNVPGTLSLTGAPVDCPTLDSSVTSALRLVGPNNIFGTTLGDMAVGIGLTCQ